MKKVLLFLVISFCFLSFTACEKQNIKIGYAGCLTGSNSELGVSGMYGAQLAVDYLNQAGGIKGRKLELLVKDDKGDKSAALEVDRELHEEGCAAIIGHMTSDMAELSVPYVNENKILMISPTIALPSLSDTDDFFIRLIPTSKDQAERIAQELVKQDIRKVQIVFSEQNMVFATYINEYLIQSLEEKNIQTQLFGSIKSGKDNSEYNHAIQSIVETDADALVVIASADVVSELAQVLYRTGFQRKVFLPAWAMTNDLVKRGGPSVEGFYGVNFVDFDCRSEEYLDFRNRYLKKYGDEPTFSSILSYESVLVVASAMSQSKSDETEALKDAIIGAQFKGLQGLLYINQYGDIERDIYLYRIEDGKFVKAD
jgi:branched-chain amino acid transport system substrate-binding protein